MEADFKEKCKGLTLTEGGSPEERKNLKKELMDPKRAQEHIQTEALKEAAKEALDKDSGNTAIRPPLPQGYDRYKR